MSAGKHTSIGRMTVTAWLCLALIFIMPVLMIEPEMIVQIQKTEEMVQSEAKLPIERPIQAESAKDKGRVVRLLEEDGSVTQLTMEEYLWRVVAAEMPANFEPEALKAQACAARTYTVRQQEMQTTKHEQGDICTDSHCCQAYITREEAALRWGLNAGEYTHKIEQAVTETDGLGILYQDVPIQALFFSSAPGRTTDAVEVWGNSVDYLKSVESPEGEEVPNYRTQVTLTAQEVKKRVLERYPAADLSGGEENWFQNINRGESSAVSSLKLGGVTLTGSQARNLFELRSPAFSVSWDGEHFIFDVTGYGHGVGMSQYGANAMARKGETFRAILEWYYAPAQVAALW